MPTRPAVHIEKAKPGDQFAAQVANGFEAIGVGDRIRDAKTIFLKPNLVTDNPDYIERGANTDVALIEALVRYLKSHTSARVLLGESETGTKTKGRRLGRTIAAMGLDRLASDLDFEIINLTEDEKVVVPIPRGRFIDQIELSKIFWESDLIINLPKLKTHKYATITCALKNMFGAIPDPLRIVYHKDIHQTLADLGSILWDKTIVLCDGQVAMEGGGPLWGTPKPMGLLLFATDSLSCDRVAHQLMGFERHQIRHIGLAEKSFGNDVGPEPRVTGLEISSLAESFEPAHRGLWIRFEEELMRHRNVVRIVFNPHVQRRLIYPFRNVFAKLRGGSYTWYVDSDR